jgi:hypothetical protein
MPTKKRGKRGPAPFILKIEGDYAAPLDRMLGKGGSLPTKSPKKKRKRRAAK